eukprot:CAMPEP_0196580496 /NCGR_PEP_ID=MMETSP1081-20130531/28836_1 /TAXON_ID=36882 /ORGANISM="Pyramimonas amylifera, Strain CCMP720" /LENGTH=536 /DNA_ID=CAMNT_0041900375 /DNA_START=55 /DNA_END=1665 /DNA_ORIENTATION=+
MVGENSRAKRTRTVDGGEKPEMTCFVGGLISQVDDAALKEFFSQYGEVTHARVIMDVATNKPKGFGFVTFSDANVASELKNLHKVTMGDRQVDIGEPQGGANSKLQKVQIQSQVSASNRKQLAQEYPPDCRVFVGGLPKGADEAALSWFFSQFGVVQDFTIIQDPKTGLSKGYGFCTYSDPSSASMVKSFGAVEYMGKSMNVGGAMRGGKAAPQMGGMQNHAVMQMGGIGGLASPLGGLQIGGGGRGAAGLMGALLPSLNPAATPSMLTSALMPSHNHPSAVPPFNLDLFANSIGLGAYGSASAFTDPSAASSYGQIGLQQSLALQHQQAGIQHPGQWGPATATPPSSGPLAALKMNTSFNVPIQVAGSIIGKGGCNLRSITGTSGASVLISKADDTTVPEGERRVDISGTQAQVAQAQELLQVLLANFPQQQLPGGGAIGSSGVAGGGAGSQDPQRTIFVGGFNIQANEQTLIQFFSQFGSVDNVKIVYNTTTGVSKGFGFVTFTKPDVASSLKSQKKLDMYGRMIDVSDATKTK